MIYNGNTKVRTAKSADYLGNAGYFDRDGVRFTYQNQQIPILSTDIF
jgi:hypothetical protein